MTVRPIGEQLADGGWNCEAENGSVRSSFHTTICVLEGLLEYERASGGSAGSVSARRPLRALRGPRPGAPSPAPGLAAAA